MTTAKPTRVLDLLSDEENDLRRSYNRKCWNNRKNLIKPEERKAAVKYLRLWTLRKYIITIIESEGL